MSQTLQVSCPICKTKVTKGADNFPFCSERCQTVDLGNWASDTYAIKGESAVDIDNMDIDSSLPTIH